MSIHDERLAHLSRTCGTVPLACMLSALLAIVAAPGRSVAQAPGEQDRALADEAEQLAAAGSFREALETVRGISDQRMRAESLLGVTDRLAQAGNQGGGAFVDFDSLINLITGTVEPESWEELGGTGTVEPFPTGVHVDSTGELTMRLRDDPSMRLAQLRQRIIAANLPEDISRTTPMRLVSLVRLEQALAERSDAGLPPTEAMRYLAGITHVQYVFVLPEEHDVVIAGPAGAWSFDEYGRVVSAESAAPVVQLDDLIVALRTCFPDGDGVFGCAISPREEGLRSVQEYLAEQGSRPLRPGQFGRMLDELRERLGPQDVSVWGVPPGSRVAHVLVETDYRMKMIGIDRAPAVRGIPSYFDLVEFDGGGPPPMDVLRWWLTLNYDAVLAGADGHAYEIRGQGARVLSENEFLTAQGQRVHTGQSEPTNRLFAENFTANYAALAETDHCFADLRNIFDLALVAALLKTQEIPASVGWDMPLFADPSRYAVAEHEAPETVETMLGYRRYPNGEILIAVSGGVEVKARETMTLERAADARLNAPLESARLNLPADRWWWDAE